MSRSTGPDQGIIDTRTEQERDAGRATRDAGSAPRRASFYRSCRAAVLAILPPGVRVWLGRTRVRLQVAESRLRAHLPTRLGGRYTPGSVECRQLGIGDLPALGSLRADLLEKPGQSAVDGVSCFCAGVFLDDRLVAAGYCVDVSDESERAFRKALFTSDFVDPAYRRRGLNQLVHAERLRLLAARGTEEVYGWVHQANGASIACFKASGFEVTQSGDVSGRLRRPGLESLLARRILGQPIITQPRS